MIDNQIHVERAIAALERFSGAVELLAKTYEKRLQLEFPPERETVHAEVFHREEEQAKQPATQEEYEAFQPEESVGRFEGIYKQATQG